MATQKLEERIEELRRLRDANSGNAEEALDPLVRKALQARSNLLVAEGAKVVGALHRANLLADLLSAYDRLFVDPVKTDPKCWGKTAIVKALVALDYAESPPFLRAVRHVQPEPMWGGQEDAAPPLRATATLALVSCTDLTRPETLRHLVEALADPSDTVRIEAVRALEQMDGDESALLLRLKAHCGDRRPYVLGQVFDSLLQLEGRRAVPFVSNFIQSGGDEVRDEAALSLGASRLTSAVQALMQAWSAPLRGEFGAVLLRALSASRDEAAIALLLDLVREGSPHDHRMALDALQLHKDTPEIQSRMESAVQSRQ